MFVPGRDADYHNPVVGLFAGVGVNGDVDLAVKALLEADESLGGVNAGDMLDLVVEELHEMLVVEGINLDEHRVGASGEMALYNLGDLLQLLGGLTVEGTLLQRYTDVGARVVTQTVGIHNIAGACDDPHVDEALQALVDGCAGYSALLSDVLRRHAGVAHHDVQDLLV